MYDLLYSAVFDVLIKIFEGLSILEPNTFPQFLGYKCAYIKGNSKEIKIYVNCVHVLLFWSY